MSERNTINLNLYKEILQNLEGKTLREKISVLQELSQIM